MADMVIGDYTAAITIDGSTHYLLIQPGSASTAYKKINRNVLLGVSGQPADISTAQSLTNKTLDNTNIVTFRDDRFTLQDSGDVTRQAQFQLSGITAGQTRVYTLPNATGTLADIATAQTFTNKTLTAPVINNGSITGTTITTDAIVGQSAATTGTIYGLSIASAKVGTNGVIAGSITDAAVTPAKLIAGTGSSWAWQTWSPTLTNLTVGAGGTLVSKYIQTGKTVFVEFTFTLGAGSAVGGDVSFTLPVTASSVYSGVTHTPLGLCYLVDEGSTIYVGSIDIQSTTAVHLAVGTASGTYLTSGAISSTVPFTWGSTDKITTVFHYEAA